jgi:hypothetical protein
MSCVVKHDWASNILNEERRNENQTSSNISQNKIS